jgi:gliding motility-associated-like protein
MNRLLYVLFFLAAFLLAPSAAWATHNRAGEIHVRQIGLLQVEATIITWTKASSTNADRDTLTIYWGDGTSQQVVRNNGPNNKGVELPNDIKYNTYVATHIYPGPSRFVISMTDPNRNGGIINVNPPTSDNVPFHIETVFSFQNTEFGGTNTTPYLLQPPIDNACIGKPFVHNPNAFDPDGDSLSYHFIVPLQSADAPVPNYTFPHLIQPGPDNTLQLDPVTGDILWITPQQAGEYNLAFIIVSWRNGAPIDTTIRDMQIFVDNCDNNPPVVTTIDQLCVVAGDTIEFLVTATDPDSGNYVQLTALGGPFDTAFSPANRAMLIGPSGWQLPPVVDTFRWVTACEQISNQPYSVVFKAVDSISATVPRLADLETVEIKVVGPPPLGLQASATQGEVELTWDKPYSCEDAANNYFYGFAVYRREGSNPFPLDTCMPGLAGKGYVEIEFVTRVEQNGRYYYKDMNVERGRTYCYRVLAKFARTSAGGYPYNLVPSLPSDEVCVQLPRDLPLITNVSVLTTDATNGQIEVCWSKPVAFDLDTVINHGPYRYQLLRAEGLNGGTYEPVPGASFEYAEFWQANDTCFTDVELGTQARPYHYRVDFYVRGESTPLGSTNDASSVFLNVASTDNTNILSWDEDVPWRNYSYTIYRRNAAGQFDSIATTNRLNYSDMGLTNGVEYCYYVRSEGTYSIGGVIDPIFNNSQESCGVPIDTVPPCVPTLEVGNLCNGQGGSPPDPPYENNLRWNNVNVSCPGTDDAVAYNVWFAVSTEAPLTLLARVEGASTVDYLHQLPEGLAGCYAISAIDSVDNESAQSARVCVDNCPQYELPNAFTPNGDDENDHFVPFAGWRFVDHVDFQVFNRWGTLVFETTDPELNWDGRNTQGKDVAEGTYLYVCRVYERRVEGVVPRAEVLSGFIEVMRGGR